MVVEAVRGAKNVAVWLSIYNERAQSGQKESLHFGAVFAYIASETLFLTQFACSVFFFSRPSRAPLSLCATNGTHRMPS